MSFGKFLVDGDVMGKFIGGLSCHGESDGGWGGERYDSSFF